MTVPAIVLTKRLCKGEVCGENEFRDPCLAQLLSGTHVSFFWGRFFFFFFFLNLNQLTKDARFPMMEIHRALELGFAKVCVDLAKIPVQAHVSRKDRARFFLFYFFFFFVSPFFSRAG